MKRVWRLFVSVILGILGSLVGGYFAFSASRGVLVRFAVEVADAIGPGAAVVALASLNVLITLVIGGIVGVNIGTRWDSRGKRDKQHT